MTILNRHLGGYLPTKDAAIAQKISTLLTTPRGTRVGRRTYGSDLTDILSQPQNPATALLARAAIAGAINTWIKEVRVKRIDHSFNADGKGVFSLSAVRTDLPGEPDFAIPDPFDKPILLGTDGAYLLSASGARLTSPIPYI